MRQVIIITGACGGLGKATAHILAKSGFDLILTDIFFPTTLMEELSIYSVDVKGFEVNVSDINSVSSFINSIYDIKGIYGLVTLAGITRDKTIKNMSMEEWDSVIDVNLKGTYIMIKEISSLILGHGSIVTIGSVVSKFGNFGQVNYVASKAGVEGITKVAAREFAKKGIRINCILPGFIKTPMVEKMPEKAIDALIAQIPMGRMGQPEEIANVIEFLISDKSSFITGASISVNGGMWMG